MSDSNGYEESAGAFIKIRSYGNIIGVSEVASWGKTLAPKSEVVDIGCGSGNPISKALVDQGLVVFGIDASPTLVRHFKTNFPDCEIRCESILESNFYSRDFDGIVAWGLLFLLPANEQEMLISKISRHLKMGGKFLFTAPWQKVQWKDLLTGRSNESLGAPAYRHILQRNRLTVLAEFDDDSGNHYYSCEKTADIIHPNR